MSASSSASRGASFAVTLQLWNTNILQPPRVVRETAEALKSDKLAAFIEWMKNNYRAGTTAVSATEVVVKTAIAGFLGVRLQAARAKMVDLGFIIVQRCASKRFIKCRFAGGADAKPVTLK
jgi:hypothetical protein